MQQSLLKMTPTESCTSPCVLDIQETSFTLQDSYEDTPLINTTNETI